MSEKTEILTTVFRADVSGLEAGQTKIRTVFDKFLSQQKGVISAFDKATDSGGALGKTLSGISDVAKGGAARMTALAGVAATVLTAAFKAAREEADRSSASIEDLFSTAVKASNRLSSVSKESGVGALGAELANAREQSKKFRDELSKRDENDPFAKQGRANLLRRGLNAAEDFRSPGVSIGDTEERASQNLRLSALQASKAEAKLEREINGALKDQLQITRDTASGNIDAARIKQLQIEKQREINELASFAGITDKQRLAIGEKYAALQNRITYDRRLAVQYGEHESDIAQMELRGETDKAAMEKQQLQFAKERQQLIYNGARIGDAEYEALRKKQIAQAEVLGIDQRYDRLKFESAMTIARVEGSNLDDRLKKLEVAKLELTAIQSELRMRKDLSVEQRRALELQQAGAQNTIRKSRQDLAFEYRNKPGTYNAMMAKLDREQTERDKFDARPDNQMPGYVPKHGPNDVMLGSDAPGGSASDRIRASWGWNPKGTLDSWRTTDPETGRVRVHNGDSNSDIRRGWGWPEEGGMSRAIMDGWAGKRGGDASGMREMGWDSTALSGGRAAMVTRGQVGMTYKTTTSGDPGVQLQETNNILRSIDAKQLK